MIDSLRQYFSKMRGITTSPPRVPFKEVVWSWIGAFLGIFAVTQASGVGSLPGLEQVFLIGSFGASAVLIYGAPHLPYAQPRNLIGGHVISALIGVSCAQLLPEHIAFAGAFAVATSIAFMHLTHTMHPPGAATALIAIMGGPAINDLGYSFVIAPVLSGAIILFIVALLVNNLAPHRQYPQFWR